MRTFIVTKINFGETGFYAALLTKDQEPAEFRVERADACSNVSCIYRGIVSSVSGNIGGAFIDIGGIKAFLPFRKGETVHASSPAAVQVTKEASGVKAPVVTTNLHLGGRYSVISKVPGPVSFSRKLSEEQKVILGAWLKDADTESFRILVRTNAAKAAKTDFLDELAGLQDSMRRILASFEHADSGDLLYEPEPFYISMLRDAYEAPEKCVTDIPLFAEKLSALSGMPSDEILYIQGSRSLTLPQLYGIPHLLDRLTGKYVWLKSGAYIVIERTEAFVSIDVNTGKCTRGRSPEETYRRINLEAASEIADQIRLRNLSGMILVDFISLSHEDHRSELVGVMKKLVKADHIHTEVVDLTPLGIMEIVRQKVRKPLEEELGLC